MTNPERQKVEQTTDRERALVEAARAYDKNRRPIEVGDVLKVFHFIGRRRKQHYMYKQVIGTRTFGEGRGGLYLLVSHLNLREWDDRDGGYALPQRGQIETDIEIVQSIDAAFEDRPRLAAQYEEPKHDRL